MVAPQNGDSVFVSDFEGKQQSDGLDAVVA